MFPALAAMRYVFVNWKKGDSDPCIANVSVDAVWEKVRPLLYQKKLFKSKILMLIELPKSKDIMENPMGFPTSFELPIIKDLTKYKNTLYAPAHVTTNWDEYKTHLASVRPSFKPRVLLMGHDMSEIENITLMALGGVVREMNGIPYYL